MIALVCIAACHLNTLDAYEKSLTDQLGDLIKDLGSNEKVVQDKAVSAITALGTEVVPQLESRLQVLEENYRIASARYHYTRNLITRIGWPGIGKLGADLKEKYGDDALITIDTGARVIETERLDAYFPNHRFVPVFLRSRGWGDDIYVVKKFETSWYYFYSLFVSAERDTGDDSVKNKLIELANDEEKTFQDSEAVEKFVDVSYAVLGPGPSLGCATGVDFRRRVERLPWGWRLYEEYQNVGFENEPHPDKWNVRCSTTLWIDDQARLLNLHQGGFEIRTK